MVALHPGHPALTKRGPVRIGALEHAEWATGHRATGGGLEATENALLSGQSDKLFYRRVSDMLTGHTPAGAAGPTASRNRAAYAADSAIVLVILKLVPIQRTAGPSPPRRGSPVARCSPSRCRPPPSRLPGRCRRR